MAIRLRRILVATDFSEPATKALEYAEALAQAFGGSVHVLHVFDSHYVQDWMNLASPADLHRLREAIESETRERLSLVMSDVEVEKFHARLVTRHGAPFREIVSYAKDEQVDLIVMGTRGRGGMVGMILGSVAERVVRTAPCPVLIVRNPEHEFVIGNESNRDAASQGKVQADSVRG